MPGTVVACMCGIHALLQNSGTLHALCRPSAAYTAAVLEQRFQRDKCMDWKNELVRRREALKVGSAVNGLFCTFLFRFAFWSISTHPVHISMIHNPWLQDLWPPPYQME
eukprot:1161263-Pelagomonas_calceolata.AAC.7